MIYNSVYDYLNGRIKKNDNGCWVWMFGVNKYGDPCGRYNGVNKTITKLIFKEHYPNQEKSKTKLHHKCGDRRCVNPQHLSERKLNQRIDILLKSNKTLSEIASECGCSQISVSRYISLIGIKKTAPHKGFKSKICDEEYKKKFIEKYYKQSADKTCSELGISKNSFFKYAKTLKLNPRKNRWLFVKHPRGMSGKEHKKELKQKLSEFHKNRWKSLSKQKQDAHINGALKNRIKKYGTLSMNNKRGNWKAAWRVFNGEKIYMRSTWEANYARILELKKSEGKIISWEHEPILFWFESIKRGVRSYLPDFRITMPDGSIEFHEVKGWMDPRSKTKLKRMKKYYPDVKIVLIDTKKYKELAGQYKIIINGWE